MEGFRSPKNKSRIAGYRLGEGHPWNRWADDVSEQLGESRSLQEKVALLERALASRYPSITSPDPMVVQTLSLLAQDRTERVDGLAWRLGVSERHLRRRFAAAVGYGPKMFQGVVRFQRLFELANEPPHRRSLNELAFAAGYADQAHMTREVSRFGAPGEGRKRPDPFRSGREYVAANDVLGPVSALRSGLAAINAVEIS